MRASYRLILHFIIKSLFILLYIGSFLIKMINTISPGSNPISWSPMFSITMVSPFKTPGLISKLTTFVSSIYPLPLQKSHALFGGTIVFLPLHMSHGLTNCDINPGASCFIVTTCPVPLHFIHLTCGALSLVPLPLQIPHITLCVILNFFVQPLYASLSVIST